MRIHEAAASNQLRPFCTVTTLTAALALAPMGQEPELSVVVVRQKIHGMDARGLHAVLRDRLGDDRVRLADTRAKEIELVPKAAMAVGYGLPDVVLDEPGALAVFACSFAGVGHLNLDRFRAAEVDVINAAGVHAPNITEQVIGAMLYFSRGFNVAVRQQQSQVWQSYPPGELAGAEAVVIGMGAIGTRVCEMLRHFEVRVTAIRHSPAKGGPTAAVVGYDDEAEIDAALATAQFVIIAAPLTEETRGFIDGQRLLTMRSDAVVINVGRGPIVDTDALVSALRSNAIGAAAVDVTDPEPLPATHPLWDFDNVLITPHNAGGTPFYWERMADIIETNLQRLEDGTPLHNHVH
jgi:Phosphoglycerate dehydrogenase and related dehydrogenases